MSDNVDTFHLFVNFSFCMVQGGYYLFVLLDDYSGNWSLIFLAIMEVSPHLAIRVVKPLKPQFPYGSVSFAMVLLP